MAGRGNHDTPEEHQAWFLTHLGARSRYLGDSPWLSRPSSCSSSTWCLDSSGVSGIILKELKVQWSHLEQVGDFLQACWRLLIVEGEEEMANEVPGKAVNSTSAGWRG